MAARKKKVSSMGKFPKNDTHGGSLTRQVEWLMVLEVTMKDITELAQEDEEMDREAYNSSMLDSVKNLFDFKIFSQLAQLSGTSKQKFVQMIAFISKLRENRQLMLKSFEAAEEVVKPSGGGGNGGADREGVGGQEVRDL